MKFITGANDKYFFMCGMLLESLQGCFPGVPCRVMDFGLSDARRRYFEEKKLLLNIPLGRSKMDHPYKLKTCMASFLNEEPLQNSIWIDSDIIAIRAESKQLLKLANDLVSQNKNIAISTDEGPNKTLEAVCNSFGEMKLQSAIADNPSLKESRYLNAGFVVFSNPDSLRTWQAVSTAQEGDMFQDQNALNIMCHGASNRVSIVDSRVWNVHAGLLRAIQVVDNEVYCEGQKPIFVHATSTYKGDLYGGTMPISAKDCGCEAYLRFFANDHLRRLQEEYLSGFLRKNFETLRNLGILNKVSNVNVRRNEPCPCGSGKKFKHCHGAHA